MMFFLSTETIAPAASRWLAANRIVEPCLKHLEPSSYGTGLNSIAIISIILPDSFFDNGGYKERKLYKRKSQEADIRLRLDYRSFLFASDEQRIRIYTKHILTSLKTLDGKVDSSFNLAKLLDDVEAAFADFQE